MTLFLFGQSLNKLYIAQPLFLIIIFILILLLLIILHLHRLPGPHWEPLEPWPDKAKFESTSKISLRHGRMRMRKPKQVHEKEED